MQMPWNWTGTEVKMLRSMLQEIETNTEIVEGLTSDELRHMASFEEKTTEFGSASYITKIRCRSAKFTEVIKEGKPNDEQKDIIKTVTEYIKGKKLIKVKRDMCQNPKMRIRCTSYYTEKYARIGYMWSNSLFDIEDDFTSEQIVVQIPEWEERKVLVDVKNNITLILGSDYFGECKKAHLRMAMHTMKERGGLGLHAGSKVVKVKDKDGQPSEKGIILFGLSGTGKTTLTVHDYNLIKPEGVIIRQDDVVLMDEHGFCYGTEDGFFIKTEGLDKDQRVLYDAATKPHAILENVHVEKDGKVDFCQYELTTNGRGIIRRSDIDGADDDVDLQKANIVVFITRRDDIVPPVAKLTAEQGAAFFMLGESIETSAGDPAKAGQSKRVVGTNPFIVGPYHEEGNRFLEILKNNPDMQCYLLNTGKVGDKDKITIRDSTTILKEIARDNIKWKLCPRWNYMIAEDVQGIEKKKLDPNNYFTEEEYNRRTEIMKTERREWLAQFPKLDQKIAFALFTKQED